MGCRTQWYGPLVTSSGSSFWVIGPPQLRPTWTRAQIANPSPIANRTSPRPSRHASVFSAWSRKTPERTRTITMTAITALIPSSRDHRMRPLLAKKAATSQKIQNAAHPRAKVSATARTSGVSPIRRMTTTPLTAPARVFGTNRPARRSSAGTGRLGRPAQVAEQGLVLGGAEPGDGVAEQGRTLVDGRAGELSRAYEDVIDALADELLRLERRGGDWTRGAGGTGGRTWTAWR